MTLRCKDYWFQRWRMAKGLIDAVMLRDWFGLHLIQCQACREWWAEQKRLMDRAVHP